MRKFIINLFTIGALTGVSISANFETNAAVKPVPQDLLNGTLSSEGDEAACPTFLQLFPRPNGVYDEPLLKSRPLTATQYSRLLCESQCCLLKGEARTQCYDTCAELNQDVDRRVWQALE